MASYNVGDKVVITKADDAYNSFVKGDIAIITGVYVSHATFYTIDICSNNSYFGETFFEPLDEGYYYGFLANDA